MNAFLRGAFVANAASMGFNWIYNMTYLEKLSQSQSLVFQPVDPQKYKRAGNSYLSYPNAQIGDISVQGEIAKWLYSALSSNPSLDIKEYEELLYEMIRPGGSYQGYVESYGKKFVYNKLVEQLTIDTDLIDRVDDHLVGFIPYLVCKELNLPLDKAWTLAQVFTSDQTYQQFYILFDNLFENLKSMSMKHALKQIASRGPKDFLDDLDYAIEMSDTKSFIMNHSGTDCHIHHSIPLIFHILSHTSSFEEAVKLNVKIGGASCDRGMLIGAIYSQVSSIPEDWLNLTNLKL